MKRFAAGLALGVAVALISSARADDAYSADDVVAAIDQASEATGVPAERLMRIVTCEDRRLDPYAVGDHGTSVGPVQLHRGGNAWPAFFAAGYSEPTNPYEAVLFLARALRGDFSHLGWWTWSCR